MSSTHNNKSVDVQDFIDNNPIGRLQWLIVGLCFLVTAIDGLDTAAIGFIAPALRTEWNLTAAGLSPVLAASLVGLTLGAFIAGPLADRYGRKSTLILSVACFGGFSLLAAFAHDVETLALLRFLTGLGLGGAMPNAITLTSEYCPRRSRSVLVTTMFCGFTLGSAMGGVVAAHLVPVYGWRSVLLLGGVLPLATLPLLIWLLPESAKYLASAGKRKEKLYAILSRIGSVPSDWNGTFRMSDGEDNLIAKSPIKLILNKGLRRGTLALWTSFFMSLFIIYMMTNWLPLLLKDTGLSLSDAAMISAMFQIGGTIGAISIGAAMDKFNPHLVLVTSYATGAICIFGTGIYATNYTALVLFVTAMGFCISGSQVGANALAANFYPTISRATGVSWAHGIGRLGSILGTTSGGIMISAGMNITNVLALMVIPATIAAAAIFYKHLSTRKVETGSLSIKV